MTAQKRYKMFDLKHRTYVISKCATADDFYRFKTGELKFSDDNIIEVAAVKIEKGKIKEHFSTFVAIEGCDLHDIEFGAENFGALGITEAHLIGAPDFKTVAERVLKFARNCTLLTYGRYQWDRDIFKEKAASYGIIFNNPTFSINNIYTALNLQNTLERHSIKFEEATTLQLATILADKGRTWKDIFEEYDVFTFFNEWGPVRQDCLTWALAYAQLFIKMVEWETDDLEEIDEKPPF